MTDADHTRARARALRTARTVTLGLALTAGAAGCTEVTDLYCETFTQGAMCCNRIPGHAWNAATNHCDSVPIYTPPPFVGPRVPPA